jgi:START domain
MRIGILTIVLLAVCSAGIRAQNWQLKKEEDGIRIYTAATPNSNVRSVKVECTLHAPLSQIIACLLDVDAQKNWVYNCKNSRLVEQIKDNEFVFYSQVDLPWPATNRDYISHITIAQPSSSLVTIDANAEPNKEPQKKGFVRVVSSRAHWDLVPMGDQTKVVYTLHFDPAGSVPAWLTNMFITKGPLLTFHKLGQEAAKEVYRNTRISFLALN